MMMFLLTPRVMSSFNLYKLRLCRDQIKIDTAEKKHIKPGIEPYLWYLQFEQAKDLGNTS